MILLLWDFQVCYLKYLFSNIYNGFEDLVLVAALPFTV